MIFAQIGSKFNNRVKRAYLGKSDWCQCCQSVISHHTKLFWNKLCDRSWDIRLNNFGRNWSQIVLSLEKRIFGEYWVMLLLSTYCAPLCLEKVLRIRSIMRYEALQFWTKLNTITLFTLKEDFCWKIDWC